MFWAVTALGALVVDVVAIVVFAILMIINFVVVTKGAGRISEVSARFTLDAMPGKQLSIDSDLRSGLIDKDVVLEADTDVVGHINGGHTALPDDQIRCICEGCKRGLELVHNGNERSALFTLRTAREMGDLHRVILGTDAPAGSGVQPLGILRMVSLLSSLGELPAELAFCLATGNTARMRELDCGLIEVGRSADFVLMDKAQHSPGKNILESVQLGDLPGIGMTIIDGIVRTQRSRNTPPAGKVPEIVAK